MIQRSRLRTSIASVASGDMVSVSSTPSFRSRALSFLDCFVGLVVILNAVVLGVSVDVDSDWFGWVCIEAFFAAAFIAEICIRVWCHGCRWFFCSGNERVTNMIEIVMVAAAVLEVCLQLASPGVANSENKYVRVFFVALRLFRVLRMLRVLRLGSLRGISFVCRCRRRDRANQSQAPGKGAARATPSRGGCAPLPPKSAPTPAPPGP